jgi:GNAT superfamily N-acetyltransferase
VRIRAAQLADLEVLREIERAAGLWFRDIGMPEIAEDEPLLAEALASYQQADRARMAVDDEDRPGAYLIWDLVDGNVHIEQVSVHPDHARKGVGRSLLEHAADQAKAAGVPALTLTTFGEVPWNAPYYLRCGFRILEESEWTPGLRQVRRQEAEHGLDRWPRVCMRRDL